MGRQFLNRFISSLADHLLLSLLWLVGCLPVLTAPVATAALFEVTRRRHHGSGHPLARSFLAALREYLPRSLLVGYGWVAVGGVLLADLMIVGRAELPAGDLLRVALLAVLLLYALGTVTLFPVLVSYRARPREVARIAMLVALLFPARSLSGLVVVASGVVAVWAVPLTVIVVPALVANALQRLCGGAFDRLRARADGPLAGPPAAVPVPH